MENYVSVEEGCLKFLDPYRFLSTNLDKLVKSINSFSIMDENGFTDEIFKKKLAYPYEYFILNNIWEPLDLTKEDFSSTLKQTTPPDEEINRTKEITKKVERKERTRINYDILKNGCSTIS